MTTKQLFAHLDTVKPSLRNSNFDKESNCPIFAGSHLESISFDFSNTSFVVEPCYKLPSVVLINGNTFGLFKLQIEIKGSTCLFSLFTELIELPKELTALS